MMFEHVSDRNCSFVHFSQEFAVFLVKCMVILIDANIPSTCQKTVDQIVCAVFVTLSLIASIKCKGYPQ